MPKPWRNIIVVVGEAMQGQRKLNIVPPMLEALRADAVRADGEVQEDIQKVISMLKTVDNNPYLEHRISLLENRWLLDEKDGFTPLEYVNIFLDPELCIKNLRHNLYLAKRYRDKDLLVSVLEQLENTYNELTLDINASKVPDIMEEVGVELFEICMTMFRVVAKPTLIQFVNFILDNTYNYARFLQDFPILKESTPTVPKGSPNNKYTKKYYQDTHKRGKGENVARGIKRAAMSYSITGHLREVDAVVRGTKVLDKYHGTVTGCFTACDHLGGRSPNTPTNVKVACGYFNALQSLLQITQDLSIADRMELMACNLLPSYFKDGKIQVMQSSNQINLDEEFKSWRYAEVKNKSFYEPSEKPEELAAIADSLGLFVRSFWMKREHGGIALIFPFACKAVFNIDGHKVAVSVTGDYPYGEDVEIKICTKEPVNFPIYIRIPGFCSGAGVSVNKEAMQPAMSDTFYTVSRTFKNGDRIKLHLPSNMKINKFYRRSCTIFKGSVIYALKQDDHAKKFDNYAIDLQMNPSITDDRKMHITGYSFKGNYTPKTQIALMPQCDLSAPINLELVPYRSITNRIAQFPSIDSSEVPMESEY